MAVTVKQEWALTTWEGKSSENVVWTPIGNAIDNIVIDGFGRKSGTNFYGSDAPRRPYKTETDEEAGTTYVMYDDDTEGAVPVIRITEEEAAAASEEA